MSSLYQRGDDLRHRFNDFLRKDLELGERDFFGSLTVDKLLKLKAILSDVNNSATMWLTLEFVDWLGQGLNFSAFDIENIRNQVLSAKPNSNGYDVCCVEPLPIVAEVKCNIPINGGCIYGAAQKRAIIRDIESLIGGKRKAASVGGDSLKFMVFWDMPAVRKANEHLKANAGEISKYIKDIDGMPDDPKVIYEVYIPLARVNNMMSVASF